MVTDQSMGTLSPNLEDARVPAFIAPLTLGLDVVTNRRLLADLLRLSAIARPLELGPIALVLFDGDLSTKDNEVAQRLATARQNQQAVAVALCPPDRLAAAEWVELGASAVLTTEVSADELYDVLERLSRGEVVLGVAVREGLLSQLRERRQNRPEKGQVFSSLTRRESEVMHALAMGSSPEDIARSCFVSMNTVRTQIRNVLTKLNVVSVAAAVAMAHRSGWLDEPLDS